MFWFAILVGMSGQLNSLGVVKHFSDLVGNHLASLNVGWPPIFGLLSVAYFGLHYMFASQTAHVSALYAAFVAMMLASGKQPSGVRCDKLALFALADSFLGMDAGHRLEHAKYNKPQGTICISFGRTRKD